MAFAVSFVLFTIVAQGFVYRTTGPVRHNWAISPRRLQRMASRAVLELDGYSFETQHWPVKPATSVMVLVASNKTAVRANLEANKMDPFGTVVWPSALAAAMELCDVANVLRDGTLQGLRVLEIGAGNGLCSLTAASLGANATATEFNPLSLQLIAESAQLQKGLKGSLDTMFFDITNEDRPLPDCDLLVCADVLYIPKLAAAVASRCAEAVSRGAGLIVTSPAGRGGEPRFNKVLVKELGKLGISQAPHWNDAILPSWADPRWPSGADDSVTQVLRYLDVPSLRAGFLSDEEAGTICYDGRWGTLRKDRARDRNRNRKWECQLPDPVPDPTQQDSKQDSKQDPPTGAGI